MKNAQTKVLLSRWTDRFLLAGGVWIILAIIAKCIVFQTQEDPFLAAVESLLAGLLASPVAKLGRELLLGK